MDYVALFHRHLGVSVKENRYRNPTEQPQAEADPVWRRPVPGTQPR